MPNSVLIVDDSPLARKMVLRALPAGWATEVRHAGNGVEALAAYRAATPDAIFLDLNMPELDGYQVLEALRGEPSLPPIVVLSGDIQPQARERVLALRARAFVKKPATAAVLEELLRSWGLL